MQGTAYSLEVTATEFVARHVWRHVRPLFARHLTPRCGRCILSAAYTSLNAQGICQLCEEQAARAALQTLAAGQADDSLRRQQTQALNQLLRAAVGQGGGAYDALLLLSGGKDSAYLLHRITQEYPELRLVCVLVDNGFMSPFALQNAKQVINRFNLPYVVLSPEPAFVRAVFRYGLTHLHLQKQYSIVDLMDGQITFDNARNFAVENDIPLILCGLSKVQLAFVFGVQGIDLTAAQQRMPLVEQCGISFAELGAPEHQHFWFDEAQIQSQAPMNHVPHVISPIAAWNPDETEILRVVESLQLIDRKKSRPLMTNNALIPVIAMAETACFGYCCWEVEFARMVREGKSERQYWLALFEMLEYTVKTGRFINRNVERTLARLGLTRADIGIHA